MSQPIHILLIEDDEEDYMITRDIVDDITDRRYQLDWVSTFEEGVAAIENKSYDVYLLDYRLGRETGLELLRQVNAHSLEPPFILLTGQDDIELDKEAMEAGVADFLIKGEITSGVLERTIRYAIQHRKTILKLQRSQKMLKEAQKLANIGHFDWDISTDEFYWSDEMYRIFGYEPQTVKVSIDFLFEKVHPDDRQKIKTSIEEVFKNKVTHSFGYRIIVKENELRYVHCTRGIEVDRKGNPLRVFGTIRDITEQKESELAIQKEKETAQMYLDIAGSMVVVIDKDEKITLLNQRGEEILGLSEKEVIGKNWFELIVPKKEKEEVRKIFDRLMNKKGKNVEYFENSILNKDGEERLIWWHNRVLFDEKGNAQGTISSGVDITELRETEQQLQASESKAKILFDYSSIVIWEEDFSEVKRNFEKLRKEGIKDFRAYLGSNLAEVKRLASLVKIKQVNQESLKFYEVNSKAELMTKLSDWFTNTSWDVFTEELIALAEGKTEFEGEIIVTTPNGGQKHLFMRLAVPPQYKDTFDTVLVSFMDISELKESQRKIEEYSQELEQKVIERTAELKESEQKLKEAQSIAKMGHWDWLAETKELVFSKGMYQIYGLTDKSPISTKLIDGLIHPEDVQFVRDEVDNVRATKKESSVNHRIITPSGELKYIRSNIQAPIFDESGKITRLFGVLKDITTQKHSELQLHEALSREKELGILKSRFVSMASHEFRTPLSSILSSAELLGMYIEAGKLEKTGKNIKRIKNSVRNLTNILKDFLSLEKLEAGKVEVQNTEIQLKEYLEELSEEIQPILRPDQQLVLQFKDIPVIQTDPYLLKNILINLLSNGIKYSPKGEDVTLDISKTKKEIVFKVIDRGIGIPPEDQQHMFSRFFRASNVENIKGTGLGLTIVKRYLDLMGGDIGFESVYGKGSTFYFHLPT